MIDWTPDQVRRQLELTEREIATLEQRLTEACAARDAQAKLLESLTKGEEG